MSRELKVWVNGKFVIEKEATISAFDQGFLRGDAVFDAARTFNGRAFQLDEHVTRLLRSCHYLGLDPQMGKEEWISIAKSVIDQNEPLRNEHGDYWIFFHVSRGIERDGFSKGTTLIVSCTPLPLRQRAKLYRDGVAILISSVRRTPPWAISPRVKTHNYLNFAIAAQEAKKLAPEAWPILLDEQGNLAEGMGSNLFLVRNGTLFTPRERYVLAGITRGTVLSLAREAGIEVREEDLDLYDLLAADEAFLTSTSLCLCPVSSVDGRALPTPIPGAVTQKLLNAYCSLVGIDVREQYLSYL